MGKVVCNKHEIAYESTENCPYCDDTPVGKDNEIIQLPEMEEDEFGTIYDPFYGFGFI
jgi:hypothetical protein